MNESPSPFSWRARGRSFIYAWKGIKTLIISEHNARIHSVAALLAIICGFIFSIAPGEWIAVILCIGIVFMAEAMNSAIEALADHASSDYHPLLGKAKDIAAAGVLFTAIAAAIVGCIIFLPRIISLFIN
ncbi:MAG: diacylglycerol kinase family protein [Muribaculaceae bacterium]|nr:diacylglycerol kinase family protein [Muribaculaceae bacterium]